MSGFVTDEDRKFVETWESVSQAMNFVIKFGPMGEHVYEQVHGQRKFTITTAERLVTQSRVAETKHDPFTNGMFRPIVVPASVNVETNPNALADEDILQIFTSSDVAWGAYMDVLDAPATLRRMLNLADQDDVEISLKRYRQLEARLLELTPRQRVTQKDSDLIASTGPAPSQIPSAGDPGTRRGGRRGSAVNPSSSSSSTAG